MVSTFTPNINLEEPARGDDVGTWDTPVNANMSVVDLVEGGIATISLNNSNVTLSAAQFRCKTITFNSTLTGAIAITFPTSFTKSYEIQNLCSGSSAFTVTMVTTAAGGQGASCPFGEIFEVLNDGANIKFKNFGRIGSYMEYAGSSAPAWLNACTVPPYLNCDGTSFSSATYPVLTTILGGTTLPDRRGTVGAALNQGTNRITSGGGGVDGNTIRTVGGVQTNTIAAGNLPALGVSITDSGHTHLNQHVSAQIGNGGTIQFSGSVLVAIGQGSGADPVTTSVTGISATANPGGANSAMTNLPPMTIYGICMIRAG
jgi:hypothetical protein